MNTKDLQLADTSHDLINSPRVDTRQRTLILINDLPPKAETFAQLVARGSALNAAYRASHNVGEDTKAKSVNESASRLAALPAVRARIRELKAAIAERMVITAAELRARQADIAFAEPLVHTKAYNCRWCATDGKHYAWADVDEFCDACEEWAASPGTKRKPSMLGGFTFDAFAAPNPRCRRCRGVGERFVYGPQDTTQLEGPQRAAYAGASVDARTGTIEVQQHDAQAAAKELAAMVPGGYAPKQSESRGVVVHVEPLRDLTPAEIADLMQQQKAIR